MIHRAAAFESVLDLFEDVPCVVTVGMTWGVWDRIRPSGGNLAVKTLGSGSSVGLGLAMSLPHRKIVVFDGDGAVLMNVNGLITVGQMQPKNLIHVVFDNKVYEASGGTPTASAVNSDLVAIAAGTGIKGALRVDTVEGFEKAVRNAFATDGPHFIVVDTKQSDEDSTLAYARIDEAENKYRFIRFLEGLEGRKLLEDAIAVKQSLRLTGP